jgi:hypothetical protein
LFNSSATFHATLIIEFYIIIIIIIIIVVVVVVMPNQNFKDFRLFMLTLNNETALPLDVLWWQMPSTVTPIYNGHSVSINIMLLN